MTELVVADWPAPTHVRAFVTTRRGGVSRLPFEYNNLALHVGDDAYCVQQNRALLARLMPGCSAIQWLDQVHGTDVHSINCRRDSLRGDGLHTGEQGLACAVLTADCLPVFLTDTAGSEVAVVHAGWRGLAAGIVERAVQEFRVPAKALLAWLGPAISQPHFEVGEEVVQQLQASILGTQFKSALFAVKSGAKESKALVDLYQVARCQLHDLGVSAVFGGNFCSYADRERFYSYRRDQITGRMASVIYMR